MQLRVLSKKETEGKISLFLNCLEKEIRTRRDREIGGVKRFSASDAIMKYVLIRLGDCAQILDFKISEMEQFQWRTRSGM